MAGLSEDVEVKVAVEGKSCRRRERKLTNNLAAAEAFVNSYYQTWNRPNGGKDLASFYVKMDPDSPLKPDITVNGNIVVSHGTLLESQTNFMKQS
jgi:NTF2-related export protein 1/2